MIEQPFAQYLLLLGLAVAVIAVFQRLRVPSSLGYLLVGVLLSPHTIGPVVESEPMGTVANFGIVFLLFTIGLNYSLPQLQNMRALVLKLGVGQVALTTFVVTVLAWAAGFPLPAAFVTGAVFAQTSTTILGKQLSEQGEEQSAHGRTALAISVFQDITAVPFLVVIPLLGAGVEFGELSTALALAAAKAVAALIVVFWAGRRLLRPLFYMVSSTHSIELFTLTVLFVCLVAAAVTSSLGLSMPFGAFLAGMMLGETEFRHQVEAVVRPFRDVLLGLFFVAVGTLFDPFAIGQVWAWAIIGMVTLLASKAILVRVLTGAAKIEANTAWRTGLLLSVGGEFGFALLAIALQGNVLNDERAQIILASVLFSMVAGAVLIRFNDVIGSRLASVKSNPQQTESLRATLENVRAFRDHVVICGYGRIGQNVARFLEGERIPFVAVDLEPTRVQQARTAGEPVYYGDAGEPDVLEAVGAKTARLLVISHEDAASALRSIEHVRTTRPNLPIMVRTRDETHVEPLRKAGATEVVPETMEAGLMIASQALLLLNVPAPRVLRRMEEVRSGRYAVLREFFTGDTPLSEILGENLKDQMRPVVVPQGAATAGSSLSNLPLEGVTVKALVRGNHRQLEPSPGTRIEAGDVLVLFGLPEKLEQAEKVIGKLL